MNARLLAMAKEQGRDVYAVETLGGELAPRLLYRVHPDGTRQLVRGAVFDELDNRSLRSDILVLPDGPTARGAATSWRVYLVSLDEAIVGLPLVGK
jgi:TldD protein